MSSRFPTLATDGGKVVAMMRKWRRRIALGFMISFSLWVIGCIILPKTVAMSRRHRIIAAITSARSVRVEEFDDGKNILATRELDDTQRVMLIRILPAIVPRGLGFSLKLCFVPHHRIIARDAAGVEFLFEICFLCDQAQHTGPSIYDIPAPGSAAVRQLFEQFGIRVADRVD